MITATNETVHNYRRARFRYEQLSGQLVSQIAEDIKHGHSIVLLGPRGIGKQVVVAEIQRRVKNVDPTTVFIRLRGEALARSTEVALAEEIHQQCSSAVSLTSTDAKSLEAVARAIRGCLERTAVDIICLVSSVDYLPDAVARRLLKVFRELTSLGQDAEGRFTVLLTGSVGLAPLVHGIDSEFCVDRQYVIQGFDAELFAELLGAYTKSMAITLDELARLQLHQQLGGNPLLLRVVMETVFDERRIQRVAHPKSIQISEVNRVLQFIGDQLAAFSDVVIRLFARLETSYDSLIMLQQLLWANRCPLNVRDPSGGSERDNPEEPTELELCGVAKRVRRENRHSGTKYKLVWASPLIKSLAKSYFSDWTLGDGFACANSWQRAFRCYAKAIQKDVPCSFSIAHRPRLNGAIRAFESELFSLAGRNNCSIEELCQFFERGCRHLLGFDEVTWWEFDDDNRKWNQKEGDSVNSEHGLQDDLFVHPSENMVRMPKCANPVERHRVFLRPPEHLTERINQLAYPDDVYALVARLPDVAGLPPKVVILSSFSSEEPLTRDRRSKADKVIDFFCSAYQQACQNRLVARQAKYQQNLLEAIPEIMRGLAGPPERTRLALGRAGDVLRENGYRRVMFSLVDHVTNEIKGVVDCRDPDDGPDIAKMTRWSLNVKQGPNGEPQYDDIQQAIVLRGETIAVPDARTHSLTNQHVVEASGHRGEVLIPLKRHGEVFGTMHVERNDRKPLDLDEIASLEFFADQLSSAIDAANWFDMLEGACHLQSDAILIIDHVDRIRFVNEAARQECARRDCQLPLGWQDEASLVNGAERFTDHYVEAVRQAQRSQSTVQRYMKGADGERPLAVIYASPLKDWRGSTVGTLLQIRDFRRLSKLLDSLKRFAACSSAEKLAEEVLSSIAQLGHKWSRLYLIDRDTEQFVGFAQKGLSKGSLVARQFREHTFVLNGKSRTDSTWICIETRVPVVLSHCTNRSDGERYITPAGLTVLNSKNEHCPQGISKEEGELWIDLPLISREENRPIGKISLECPQDLTPEQFGDLQVLAEAASASFSVIAAWKKRDEEEAIRRREAMHFAIGQTCHQLKAKLTALSVLGLLYDNATSDEVNELNEKWDAYLAEIQDSLDEAHVYLKPVRPEKKRHCVLKLFRSVFTELVPRGYRIAPSTGEFLVDIDPQRFREIIVELAMNSRKAVGETRPLQMSATVESIYMRGLPWCRIEIRDNGPGIRRERISRVFEEFFSEWPDTGTRGTGLGLPFVERVVEAHGGNIEAVESDTGACFRIELPRYDQRSSVHSRSFPAGRSRGGLS